MSVPEPAHQPSPDDQPSRKRPRVSQPGRGLLRRGRLGRGRFRLTRRRTIAAVVSVLAVAALIGWANRPAPRQFRTISAMLTVLSGPDADQPTAIDVTLYLPNSASPTNPVPAVLIAHGFGGSKDSSAPQARDLANRGFAALTWTAQGFGRSGGQIHLNSPDYEIRDAKALIDELARRPDIVRDGPGDPRVGVVGGSYGGALALLLAGYDQRVDAIVPMITWNDLATSLVPESSGAGPEHGVFKRQWAGLFFGRAGTTGQLSAASGATVRTPGDAENRGDAGTESDAVTCGRFARDVCQAYLNLAAGLGGDAAHRQALALLRRSSPASIVDRITAPTLLIQGQADSLFPLAEADANYRGIAGHGTPVRVDWFSGGHDGGLGPETDQDRTNQLTNEWLDYYLRGVGDDPGTGFTYSRLSGFDADTRRMTAAGFSAPAYPGLGGASQQTTVDVAGPVQRIANPPNGNPAAVSSLPGTGVGSLAGLIGSALEVPGQHADFYSTPLATSVDVVGSPTIRIRAASPTGEAVLFLKLYDNEPGSGDTLPFGLTAPVRLTGLPAAVADATPVTVTLPSIVHRFEAGHRLHVTVSSTDQAFATPALPTTYTIGLDRQTSALRLPMVASTPIQDPQAHLRWVLVALIGAILAGLLVAAGIGRVRRRRRSTALTAAAQETPLIVRGLRKEYADGFVAVSTVDFTVERGQVVGLLGPNGAGKTTTLRVLLGMTRATRGEVLIFGHRLEPGADVLTRIGALVEGPGFLPHLSGLDNLRLYWRSTGRPASDAHFDEALDIAGLGDAVHRKVSKYSHGMKQRLAIAQAMLGLPELLVLDEPTDGLDPPQIAQMRQVLHNYATGGRSVLVSSHLLAEVEQTCSHVVVMHKGEVVAQGPVDSIVGDSPVAQFDVSNVEQATSVLAGIAGVRSVSTDALRPPGPDGRGGVFADLHTVPRGDAVAALVAAGVSVDRVVPRRRLEDAFLSLVGGDTKASGQR